MKKTTGRVTIPALTGEYASEEELLIWVREFFLTVVMNVAQAPLYSLHDDILPFFSDAFDIEEIRGHDFPEIKEIAVDAFLNVIIVSRLDVSRSHTEYQALRASSPVLYEAAERLLEWSKRFNLTGRQVEIGEDADPRALRIARLDSVWPMVAALETILQWHFVGVRLLTLGGVPMWRQRSFQFPKEREILPQITLRTHHFGPTARVSTELSEELGPKGLDTGFIEVDTPGWYVQIESEANFRRRARIDFERWLRGYIAKKHDAARAAGLVKGPGKRDLQRFVWAAQYQVNGAIVADLARKSSVSKEAVIEAVNWVLNLIRLKPRPQRRGPKRTSRAVVK